jgi:hypothetical protein
MLWYEWTRVFKARTGNMVSASTLGKILTHRDPGYRSVYGFSEADAKEIRATGASKGFREYTPASDQIIIDLDDGERTLPIALDRILERGLRCEVWFSGGKGYHLVLQHRLIVDKRLPYSQFLYVSDLLEGLEFDASLYRASSLISLPGRVHPKTKIKKHLVAVWEGETVNLELQQKPEARFNFDGPGDLNKLQEAISHLQSLSIRQPTRGQRHNRIWLCAKCFCEAGIGIDGVLELLQAVNASWPNPKTEGEVSAAVEQAYG